VSPLSASIGLNVVLLAMIVHQHIHSARLRRVLAERSALITDILGGTHDHVAKEIAAAGEALGRTVRRFDLSRIWKRLGQEERRA
jgi:hypothetical protein